jgi:predicted PurR-regulated permease PerM
VSPTADASGGLLFNALLQPVVRWLRRARIPAPVGATIVVLLALGVLGGAGLLLSRPVQDWAQQAPQRLSAARTKLEQLRRPVQQVTRTVERIQQEATGGDSVGRGKGSPPPPAPGPGLATRLFGTTASLLGGILEATVLVFLLLATGDLFSRKLARAVPPSRVRDAPGLIRRIEDVVSRYIVATALINAGQAVAVALVMQLLGMPEPFLWGLLTFGLEFLPYLGAAFMIAMLSVVSFATFQGLGHILLVPGSYFAITTIQNNVVSPFVYGNRLRLNPVAVLLAVLFWWVLWGVAGAFLAVPILATVKLIADASGQWKRLGEALEE